MNLKLKSISVDDVIQGVDEVAVDTLGCMEHIDITCHGERLCRVMVGMPSTADGMYYVYIDSMPGMKFREVSATQGRGGTGGNSILLRIEKRSWRV